ncbi:MAG TPA: malto-oligosyltrehalose synthase [Rhodanobacteraceae bacterium]|nr:malto-oligosyltrehalose synthase [Rhodanobacteraceae bacterium]
MIPRATYRLQFNRDFTFADAAALVSYLASLGVSHLYASPWLKARAGSTHGYDIIDHDAVNPELGGEAGLQRLNQALSKHDLKQILDFVPNHMGVAQAENAWWLDVLEWGRASPFADYFDIDWSPPDPDLRNKLLLPVLGEPYGTTLEAGELIVRFDPAHGTFNICYHDHRFPLAPHSYAIPLRAAMAEDSRAAAKLEPLAAAFERLKIHAGTSAKRIAQVRKEADALKARLASNTSLHPALTRGAAALAGVSGEPQTFHSLHRLLEQQAYRLAYWRAAADELNYRRFFDINALAAIRVEDREVFERTHQLVARLLAEGNLDGLRIDHIDGLFDPAQYLRRVRRLTTRRFYLVVEKILEQHEQLPARWPVDGTTGYEFLNQVNGLLVNARSESALTRTYQGFIGRNLDFEEVLYAAKKQVIGTSFNGDLHRLALQLHRIAQQDRHTRDCTLHGLTRALREIVAVFPVYRTYVDARGASAQDRGVIAQAVQQARAHSHPPAADLFDFVASALNTELVETGSYKRQDVLRFAMRFQQFTGPVMAKGFEDTALYRYHRLTALNEVGGDPHRFGLSVAAFHAANAQRAEHWPHTMLTTATHDTKRGEDMRARLCALSEIPWEWSRVVRRWSRINRPHKQAIAGTAPDRNDEYLLYETLIGAWPAELMDGRWNSKAAADFRARVQSYMVKALREAKQHSSWADPDTRYEQAAQGFVTRILDAESGRAFLDAFLPLQARVAELGAHNSLVQLALKLTCPGVPDIYQGGELWDFSLVDPDNRRPVDFGARAHLLKKIAALDTSTPQRLAEEIRKMRSDWHDGTIKLYVLRRLLQLRAAQPTLFEKGDYHPLRVQGVDPDSAIAFERTTGKTRIIVAAILRARRAKSIARRITLSFPPENPLAFVDALTGQRYAMDREIDGRRLFAQLPVAVLATERQTAPSRKSRASKRAARS